MSLRALSPSHKLAGSSVSNTLFVALAGTSTGRKGESHLGQLNFPSQPLLKGDQRPGESDEQGGDRTAAEHRASPFPPTGILVGPGGAEGRQAPALLTLTLDVEKGAEAGSGQLAGAGRGLTGQRPQQSRQGAKGQVGTSCLQGREEEPGLEVAPALPCVSHPCPAQARTGQRGHPIALRWGTPQPVHSWAELPCQAPLQVGAHGGHPSSPEKRLHLCSPPAAGRRPAGPSCTPTDCPRRARTTGPGAEQLCLPRGIFPFPTSLSISLPSWHFP